MKRSTKKRILSAVMTASMIVSLAPAGIYAAEADSAEADVVYVETADEMTAAPFDAEETPDEIILSTDGQAVPEAIISAEDFGEEPQAAGSGNMEPGVQEETQEEEISAVGGEQPQEIRIEEIAEAESEPDLAVWEEPEEAAEETGYALMNIPYAAFYQAAGVAGSANYDAMSSATNKAGNYGKSGGAFHSKQTAEVGADGTISAVGGANGAKNEGVIWPVKISESAKGKLGSLGGAEITSESKVMTATLGRGSTSANYLVSYEALTEAPAYSYYYLSSEPANYLTLDVDSQGKAQFSSGKDGTVSGGAIEIADSYGTHHADVQLVAEAASQALGDKLVNAVIITTSGGSSGLVHVDNIWAANELGWNVGSGLDLGGKTITGIRYYCSVKDDSVGEDNGGAPDYQNYVYEYSVNKAVKKYNNAETLKAEFERSSSVAVTGLPADIQNPKAAVYHTDGGRPATLTYLTPTTKDGDGNTVPEEVKIENGKIALASAPTDGTEYTVAVSSDNYAFSTITTTYKAAEPAPGPETEKPEQEVRYTVTYKVNGQKNVKNMPSGSTAYKEGKNAVVKGKPVSKTSFFAGWNTKADGKGKTYQAGDKIKMTANITLYAQWKDTCTVSKLTYKVSGYSQVTCTGTTGKNQTSVRIPANIKYSGIAYKVTAVAKNAFANSTKLKTAVIGHNVKTIGSKAFYKCTALKAVVIGKGLVTIGRNAFDFAKKGCVIKINSTKLSDVKTAISRGTENMVVKVPKSRLSAYRKLIEKTAKDVSVKVN